MVNVISETTVQAAQIELVQVPDPKTAYQVARQVAVRRAKGLNVFSAGKTGTDETVLFITIGDPETVQGSLFPVFDDPVWVWSMLDDGAMSSVVLADVAAFLNADRVVVAAHGPLADAICEQLEQLVQSLPVMVVTDNPAGQYQVVIATSPNRGLIVQHEGHPDWPNRLVLRRGRASAEAGRDVFFEGR